MSRLKWRMGVANAAPIPARFIVVAAMNLTGADDNCYEHEARVE